MMTPCKPEQQVGSTPVRNNHQLIPNRLDDYSLLARIWLRNLPEAVDWRRGCSAGTPPTGLPALRPSFLCTGEIILSCGSLSVRWVPCLFSLSRPAEASAR